MNWHAGDTALIIDAEERDRHELVGKTCVLVAYHGFYEGERRNVITAWRVVVNGRPWIVSEPCLRKPYDGHNLAQWSECVWQPTVVLEELM